MMSSNRKGFSLIHHLLMPIGDIRISEVASAARTNRLYWRMKDVPPQY
jgi:hypothetical protein